MVLKNLFTGQQWRNRHREQTCGRGQRGGEGEMYGETNMETYITMCKIDSQQDFAIRHNRCSVTASWVTYVCLRWLIHVAVRQKPAQHCKTIMLQLIFF